MAFRELQNTFSLGELDPILYSRADFEGYFKSARKLRNVLVLPQGGIIRRFGMNYLFTVEDTDDMAVITDADEVNGLAYLFSASKTFLIVARPHDRTGTPAVAFEVWLNGALQQTVTTTDYTIAQIQDLYFLPAKDRVLILHKDVQPHQFKRVADNNWNLSAITFNYVPTFDYSIIDGTSYRGAGDTFTPSATTGAGITVTGSGAFFTQGHVGGLFFGNGGIFRITAVNAGGTIATGDTVEDFSSTAAIKGVNAVLLEKAWGDDTGGTPATASARGWPSRGAFFQNRLVLARAAELVNVMWFSNSGDFYNFDDSEALDTNAFAIGVGSDGNEVIEDVVSAKTIVAVGAIGLHSSSLFLENPVTPSNAFVNQQDEIGSGQLKAHHVDGQILYVHDNLQRINAGSFNLQSNSVDIYDVSIFSAHLIDTPIDTSVYRPADNNGTFYNVVNADGSLAVFQSLVEQTIQAWTLSTTRGKFKKIFSAKNDAWALVERQIGTNTTVAGDIDNVYTAPSKFQSFTDITAASQDAATDVAILTNDDDYILIGHQMPYTRLAMAFNTAANADLDLTFEYLNSVGVWTAFTPSADGTNGFTGNGTIVWDTDTLVDDWWALDIRDYLDNGAYFPPNTLNGPVDKYWIRIKRQAPGLIPTAFNADSTFLVFTDIAADLDSAASDVEMFTNDGDYLVLGNPSTFGTINVDLNTVASADIGATFEYLDSSGTWVTFAPTDNTTGFTGNGSITWTISNLADWAPGTVAGNSGLYWVRIRRTTAVVATPPIENTIYFNITTTPIEDTLQINCAKRLHIEELDFAEYMDSQEATTSDANALVTGLDHLVSQQVWVLVDGVPEGPYIVDTNGEITISTESSTDVKVGLQYYPEVTPNPLISRAFYQQNVYEPKHIQAVYVDFYQSLGVHVNGFEIPTLSLNNFASDQAPKPEDNFWEYTPMRGWNPRQEINITQELPLPMTLIGVGYKMEVS